MILRLAGIGLAACVLAADDATKKEDVWPNCLMHDKAFRTPNPIYVDVRRFINHPDSVRHRTITYSADEQVGMALRDQPHDLGEVVLDVVKGGQAEKAGVRKGWIIREINGKPFSPTERLKDVANDFDKAKKAGSSLTVKYDVKSYFDCDNGMCSRSDRFPAETIERCSEACNLVVECLWWQFGAQDADTMCLLHGKSQGFIYSAGSTIGSRECAPKASWGLSSSWPQCIMKNTHIYSEAGIVFADVRKFIAHADELRHRTVSFTSDTDFGLILREKPHAEGEIVSDVDHGSQAWNLGVRTGWIITEVSGKSFKKGEGVDDANEEFRKLKGTAPALVVKFDVRSSQDCTDGDCSKSDKLPVVSEAACAEVCSLVPECQWWTVGFEAEDKMCWLRKSGKPAKATEGSSAGDKTCSPPRSYLFSGGGGGGGWTRTFIMIGLVAAAWKFREALMAVLIGVLAQLSKPRVTGKLGVPALELSSGRDCSLDDDFEEDANEHCSLIGRNRKPAGSDGYDFAL